MKLTSKPLAAIIVILIFGGIAITSALNWWSTTTTKVPARYTGGEAAGQYNPADIRGSYTLGDIEQSFNVPAAVLKTAFAIPAEKDASAFQVKGLEELYATSPVEIGTASVRLFVAFYTGVPFDLSTDTYLPVQAAKIVIEQGRLTPEQRAYLEKHTVDPTRPGAATPAPTSASEERVVKGKTTFQELLDWGVAPAAIQQITGGEMPPTNLGIKDYCTQKGLDDITVRNALQKEVDQLAP